mmetsp:Transcript_28537/g.71833  ORF Transcript_28537/g.71833 Transcript_28537/m.71833 type:complete len:278 (+) Transcript_28537:65-898(+)|eukprot:CAMPEP_0173422334 /NCGR_PEP_ID=MMETSP1357-20121228/3085_1 /TAXON_ID=77926 /ORGANISM="Hemiselmis rufescens, Strain PCC563" /LENGTH=277 /DNA_ID=CAMNT_0014385353 /DNA_START=61 /DNA_END=894 /DNA_ORIENTATION=+
MLRCTLLLLAAACASATIAPPSVATGLLPSVSATVSSIGHLAFPNISHTRSDVLLSQASALCFVTPPPLKSARLTLRAGGGRLRMAASGSDENPVVDSLKRALVFVERVMVTLTSGTEMAKAQAVMEEDRLFGSRRLAKVRDYVGTSLTNARDKTKTLFKAEDTASLKDCYSSGPFSEPATVPVNAGRKLWRHPEGAYEHEDTADMLDCYSPWSPVSASEGYFGEGGAELSGGYNEGVAGDDLPLLKDLHVVRKADKKYTADRVMKKYPGVSKPHHQ